MRTRLCSAAFGSYGTRSLPTTPLTRENNLLVITCSCGCCSAGPSVLLEGPANFREGPCKKPQVPRHKPRLALRYKIKTSPDHPFVSRSDCGRNVYGGGDNVVLVRADYSSPRLCVVGVVKRAPFLVAQANDYRDRLIYVAA